MQRKNASNKNIFSVCAAKSDIVICVVEMCLFVKIKALHSKCSFLWLFLKADITRC